MGSKRFESFKQVQITNFNCVENIFQHPSTNVFWAGPNEDYAAHYAVCKYRSRGPFWAAQGKPGAAVQLMKTGVLSSFLSRF
jgi:hypothetical protein